MPEKIEFPALIAIKTKEDRDEEQNYNDLKSHPVVIVQVVMNLALCRIYSQKDLDAIKALPYVTSVKVAR